MNHQVQTYKREEKKWSHKSRKRALLIPYSLVCPFVFLSSVFLAPDQKWSDPKPFSLFYFIFLQVAAAAAAAVVVVFLFGLD